MFGVKIDAQSLMRIFLIGTILVLTGSLAIGQINFVAGYRAGFMSSNNELNQIVSEFNDLVSIDTSTVNLNRTITTEQYRGDGFGKLTYLNGVDLGLYYRMDDIIFELGWKNKRKEVEATYRVDEVRETLNIAGPDADSTYKFVSSSFRDYEHRISTSVNSVSLGFQYLVEFIGIGATLDYNWLRVSSDFEEADSTIDIKDSGLSSHISLSFHFGTSGPLGITIQPYVQLYLKDFQYSDTRSGNLNTFGIALLVRNGPQRPW